VESVCLGYLIRKLSSEWTASRRGRSADSLAAVAVMLGLGSIAVMIRQCSCSTFAAISASLDPVSKGSASAEMGAGGGLLEG